MNLGLPIKVLTVTSHHTVFEILTHKAKKEACFLHPPLFDDALTQGNVFEFLDETCEFVCWYNVANACTTVQGSHHHRHHRHSSDGGKQVGSKTIEQLRAERIHREQQERQRAEQLLAKMQGGTAPVNTEPIADDRQRRYNSQFNPDIARRPRPRDS